MHTNALIKIIIASLLFTYLIVHEFNQTEARAQDTPVRLASETVTQEWPRLRSPMPVLVYPEEAKKLAVEGSVVVEFHVDNNGNVYNAEVVEGIGYGCDEEALHFVEQVEFEAGERKNNDGTPRLFRTAITFRII